MTQLLPCLLVLTMAALRFPTWRQDKRDPVFPAALLALLAVTLNADPVYLVVDRALGGVNLANLLVHLMLMSGLFLLRGAISDAAFGKALISRKPAIAVFGVAVGVQMLAFGLSDTPETALRFTNTYGHLPWVDAYMVSFALYLAMVFAEVLFASATYLYAMSGALRTGFLIVTLGASLSLISALAQVGNVLLRGIEGMDSTADALSTVYKVYQLLGLAFFGAGFGIPPFNTYLARRRDTRWLHGAMEEVSPVWKRTVGSTSDPASFLPPDDAAELRSRIYRMVVEIYDYQLAAGASVLSSREEKALREVERGLEGVPRFA